jgi:hypothetical protein
MFDDSSSYTCGIYTFLRIMVDFVYLDYQGCGMKFSTNEMHVDCRMLLSAALQAARREVYAGPAKTGRSHLSLRRLVFGFPGGVEGGLTPWNPRHHVACFDCCTIGCVNGIEGKLSLALISSCLL